MEASGRRPVTSDLRLDLLRFYASYFCNDPMLIKRTCEHCGKSFTPKLYGEKARFCKDTCRVAHHRQTRKELAKTDWHSPLEYIEAARSVMSAIDLDPASCAKANQIVRATRFYSVKDDGLKQPWFGRIWLNPPYGRKAPKFIERFALLFGQGRIECGILLLGTHHLTTHWIGALYACDPIGCLPPRRLQFSGSSSHPAHGSVIVGIGVDKEKFSLAFTTLGRIVRF